MHGTITTPPTMYGTDYSQWGAEEDRREAAIAMDKAAMFALAKYHPDKATCPDVQRIIKRAREREAPQIISYDRVRRDRLARALRRARKPTMKFILEVIAARHGVQPSEILQRSRKSQFVIPRNETYYIIRKLRPDLSTPQIGRFFNGRDHTTILYGIAKHAADNGLPNLTGLTMRKMKAGRNWRNSK